jgi:hypothetical protein
MSTRPFPNRRGNHTTDESKRFYGHANRCVMPDKFKTPGQALVNIETGDKILVMGEATRAKRSTGDGRS